MSDKVAKDESTDHVDVDLGDDVGEVLGDIEEVLSTAPPPMTGWSEIPPARPTVDHLAELAAQLESERANAPSGLIEEFAVSEDYISVDDTPDISVESVEVDASDFGYEEPTHDWTRMPMPPDSFPSVDEPRDEMPSLMEPDPVETLRPSAVSLSPYRPQPKRRVPVGLTIGAAVAVAAAIVSYRLGPHSGTAQAEPARYVAAQTQRAPQPLLTAAEEGATERAASTEAQKLMIKVTPSYAYLSIRTLEEREGKRTTGPWPRIFELTPGEYELVAFRAGHQSVVRRITIEPGVKPPAMELKLQVDDIYE